MTIDDERFRFYRADGTYEVLDSAKEVVRRRIECAAELDRLRAIEAAITPEFVACVKVYAEVYRMATSVGISSYNEAYGESRKACDTFLAAVSKEPSDA